MGTQLEIYRPKTLTEYNEIGAIIVKSKLAAQLTDTEKAVLTVMAGAELGFPPIYSMTKISIVKGRVCVGYEAMASKIKSSDRYDYTVKEHTDKKCALEFFDKGKMVYTSEFTLEDAKRAGVVSPGGGWEKWPKAMLFSKALSQGARIVCPNVIGGAYTNEDMGRATNEQGDIIEGTITEVPVTTEPQKTEVEKEAPLTADEFKTQLAELGIKGTKAILDTLKLANNDELKSKYPTRKQVIGALREAMKPKEEPKKEAMEACTRCGTCNVELSKINDELVCMECAIG